MKKAVKIAFVGPESTGKTTLARRLAAFLGVPYVPEAARHFLEHHGPHYDECDILTMLSRQLRSEAAAQARTALLVTDTNPLVYHVWLLDKFRRDHPYLHDLLLDYHYITLLLWPDIPWTPDPLREDPHRREAILTTYRHELVRFRLPFHAIRGQGEKRWQSVLKALSQAGIQTAG